MGNSEYLKRFTRNIGLLTEKEQLKLKDSTVAIAGVGGVGGFPAERLARLGVGCIKIADPEVFTESDLNRQFGSSTKTLGKKKVDVISEILKDINPEIKVDVYPEGVNKGNIDNFLDGVDLVIDAIEFFTFEARLVLYPKAREKGIHIILSGATAFGSPLMVFPPDGMKMEKIFGLENLGNKPIDYLSIFRKFYKEMPEFVTEEKIRKFVNRESPASTLSPTCALAGSLLAEESLFLLLRKREPLVVPKCVMIDLAKRTFIEIDLMGENKQ